MTRTPIRPRTAGAVLAGIALALAALVPAAPAAAAEGDGWLRVAHLSPDTKSVDVQLTSLDGGEVLYELNDVGYGAVSPYAEFPAGFYTISMVPTGADGAEPVISSSVEVTSGRTATVAAYGRNADIDVKVFSDDLTAPSADQARIRLIQASTVTDSVDVATTSGRTIATDARSGSATGYAEVEAGAWTLELTGDDADGEASVDLASGSVSTLFVVDNASGGLTVLPVLDSAAAAATPVGGVQTGGGYLATHSELAGLAKQRGPVR